MVVVRHLANDHAPARAGRRRLRRSSWCASAGSPPSSSSAAARSSRRYWAVVKRRCCAQQAAPSGGAAELRASPCTAYSSIIYQDHHCAWGAAGAHAVPSPAAAAERFGLFPSCQIRERSAREWMIMAARHEPPIALLSVKSVRSRPFHPSLVFALLRRRSAAGGPLRISPSDVPTRGRVALRCTDVLLLPPHPSARPLAARANRKVVVARTCRGQRQARMGWCGQAPRSLCFLGARLHHHHHRRCG